MTRAPVAPLHLFYTEHVPAYVRTCVRNRHETDESTCMLVSASKMGDSGVTTGDYHCRRRLQYMQRDKTGRLPPIQAGPSSRKLRTDLERSYGHACTRNRTCTPNGRGPETRCDWQV